MAVTSRPPARSGGGYIQRPQPSGLADVLDLILDKGLVIDAYVRVSLIGIEILTIDARIVIASVDTYLRFAEAVGRLDIAQEGAKEKLFGDDDEDKEDQGDDEEKSGSRRRSSSSSGSSSSRSGSSSRS